MLTVVIDAQSGPATINVQIDESASADDLRTAWNDAANGTLQRQIRDALAFECIERGIDPRNVVSEPPLS